MDVHTPLRSDPFIPYNVTYKTTLGSVPYVCVRILFVYEPSMNGSYIGGVYTSIYLS